ncbi:MAG: ABC transporter permease, partial [Saprospiraceae bacterium]|nr:ABC transporter permease [Saprospiraceae bacterium]
TSGIGSYRYLSGLDRLGSLVAHLFLPVLCLLLAALAYLTRQMRGAMLSEMGKDYIRMARVKGLSDRAVYWKHAFRNALFPMITLVGAAIPASISGSVIIEVIFNIPGMGRLLYDGILRQDWPVVFTIVLLSALLTVIGYLVSDLLYRIVDPRVRIAHR